MSADECWPADVAAALERRIVAAGARPDFLDVVTRAHELDSQAVSAEAVAEADAMTADEHREHPPLRAPTHEAEADVALEAWLDDVRAAVERRAEQRSAAGLPELPVPRRRRATWWLVGVAVAAAVLLVVGAAQVVSLMAAEPSETPEQALHLGTVSGSTGSVELAHPRREPAAAARDDRHRERVRVEPEPEPEATPELPANEPGSEPERVAKPRRAKSKADRFAALAEQAQAHWRAGRHDEAQRLFTVITAEAGRSRAAELAFADLFTLASQAGDVAAQRKHWKAYLRRFPRGRFADDARAGLCRSAPAADRAACWAAYLDDFPRGSFRREARDAQPEVPR